MVLEHSEGGSRALEISLPPRITFPCSGIMRDLWTCLFSLRDRNCLRELYFLKLGVNNGGTIFDVAIVAFVIVIK